MHSGTREHRVRRRDNTVLALAWASAIALLVAGGPVHVFAGLVVVFGCAAMATLAIVGLLLGADVGDAARVALKRSGVVAAVAVVSVGFGWALRSWLGPIEVAWCERQVGAIEEYRAIHGEYPSDLDDVAELEASPWVFRPTYVRLPRELDKFTFYVAATPIREQVWSSRNRCWLSDDGQ